MGSVNANARSMKLRTIFCQTAALSQENSVALMNKLSLNSAFSWALWILYEANEPIVSEWAKQQCWCFQQLSVKSSHQTNPPWYPTVAIWLKACWTTWCWSASTGPRGSPAELQGGGLAWSHPSTLCSTVWANHNVTTAVSPSTERYAL